MGAFNTVSTKQACPSCKKVNEVDVQFKYGDTWQFKYRIGDKLRWGGNDVGAPGAKRVVLDAVMEDCPSCGAPGRDCEVWIEEDRITAVSPASGKYDFVKNHQSYIVIEK